MLNIPFSIITAVIFLVPGFVSNRVYRAFYKVKRNSDWTEAVSALISSLWILMIIFTAEWIFDFSILETGNQTSPDLKMISSLLGAGYAWGFLRVGIHSLQFFLAKKYSKLSSILPDQGTIWALTNVTGQNGWAKVITNDGYIYLGWISDWNYDPDVTDFDFLLSHASKVDINLIKEYDIHGKGIYFMSKSISHIEFHQGDSDFTDTKDLNSETEIKNLPNN